MSPLNMRHIKLLSVSGGHVNQTLSVILKVVTAKKLGKTKKAKIPQSCQTLLINHVIIFGVI